MKNPEQLLANADFQVQEMIPGEESQPFLECLSRQFANKPVKYMRLNVSEDIPDLYVHLNLSRPSTKNFFNVLLQNDSFLSEMNALFNHPDDTFGIPEEERKLLMNFSPSLFTLLGLLAEALSLGGAYPAKWPYTDEELLHITLRFLKDLFPLPFSSYHCLHIRGAWHTWFEQAFSGWDNTFLIFTQKNVHELTVIAYSDVD